MLVANLYCIFASKKAPGGWTTVTHNITNPVAWKSYYF